jgi:hypothetical protein
MFSSSKPQFHFDRQPTSTLGDKDFILRYISV